MVISYNKCLLFTGHHKSPQPKITLRQSLQSSFLPCCTANNSTIGTNNTSAGSQFLPWCLSFILSSLAATNQLSHQLVLSSTSLTTNQFNHICHNQCRLLFHKVPHTVTLSWVTSLLQGFVVQLLSMNETSGWYWCVYKNYPRPYAIPSS
jgi:hypothetical protein